MCSCDCNFPVWCVFWGDGRPPPSRSGASLANWKSLVPAGVSWFCYRAALNSGCRSEPPGRSDNPEVWSPGAHREGYGGYTVLNIGTCPHQHRRLRLAVFTLTASRDEVLVWRRPCWHVWGRGGSAFVRSSQESSELLEGSHPCGYPRAILIRAAALPPPPCPPRHLSRAWTSNKETGVQMPRLPRMWRGLLV